MRNLYLRIFATFWTAMALVLACTLAATLWLTQQRIEHLQNRQDELAREASNALAANGVPGLQSWTRRQIDLLPQYDRLYVIDQNGTDVLGRPVPDYLQMRAGHQPVPPPEVFHDVRLLSQVVSSNNRIYGISLLHNWSWIFGVFGSSQALIATLVTTLLASTCVCFLLARYLSDPVRHLRIATRSIADGDLRVRVSTLLGRRRDELALLAFDFDAMAERLRGLLESQRQLLRDVSHELRSPLARLQIALGLARRPGANLEQEFDRIEQETQRLNELIGEILSLSRLKDPARELAAEPVNLEELLETLAENARVEAEPRWVRVEFHSPHALTVDGDRELLFRALENVIRNAINYSPSGSLVELIAHQHGQQAVIRVTDQGPGVPTELLGRIFEPFFRVGKAREHVPGGHGIGLAITARVAALHGGSVQAHNVPSGGLQVDFTLPLHRMAAAADAVDAVGDVDITLPGTPSAAAARVAIVTR